MITLTRPEELRILGRFAPEFLERLRNRFLVEQVMTAVADGRIPASAWPPIAGGAKNFFITNAEAISMLTDHGVGIDAGTAAVVEIYDDTGGAAPADADAAIGTHVLLASLLCSATAFTSVADNAPGALATFAAIANDTSADATGTAQFFRIKTQTGGTVTDQGTVGVGTFDLAVNTVAFTAGSTVSITAATMELEEGP